MLHFSELGKVAFLTLLSSLGIKGFRTLSTAQGVCYYLRDMHVYPPFPLAKGHKTYHQQAMGHKMYRHHSQLMLLHHQKSQ
jgi:hypothetical protein